MLKHERGICSVLNKHADKKRFAGRPSFEAAESHADAVFRKECQHVNLSKEASSPPWQQLYVQLETLILSGKLIAKSQVPSEPLLCEFFSVSKPVVRHAISALANKGLVIKMPRKGMFVGERPKESGFVISNLSLFDDMIARGAKIDTETFDFGTYPTDEDEQRGLDLAEGDEVIRITRVFKIDETPSTYSVMSFPAALLPGFDRNAIRGQSILAVVLNNCGLKIVRAERWLDAVVPPKLMCHRMGQDLKPMVAIESVGYNSDGTRIEYYRANYDSSAARIKISVSD